MGPAWAGEILPGTPGTHHLVAEGLAPPAGRARELATRLTGMITYRFGRTVTQARHGRGGGAGDHADGVTRIVNPPGRVTRQLGDVLSYSRPDPVQQDADLGSGSVK
jgi:hypothetical protein